MANWERTNFPGVYYREHPTRTHGIRPDRYYSVTYHWEGKKKWEAVGWASQGMKPVTAAAILAELKENQRTGSGPATLAEKRKNAERERQEAQRAREEESLMDITFQNFADIQYFPIAEPGWKPETARKHKEHCTTWLYPNLGSKPLRKIGLADANKVKGAMMKAGRRPRTMQAVFRTFSMIWAAARDAEIVTSKAPNQKASFKLPKIDNERMRYLTSDESETLLECVRARSRQVADMALVSLESGLRFGEVAALTWGAVDLESHSLRVLNTKGKKDRIVPMTTRLQAVFKDLERGAANEIVFPTRLGTRHQQVPSLFKRGLEDSKLNDDVDDSKMKASFHTLRHTFASRMVQQGVDLYKLQRILGHSTPALTARYAKLADEDLHEAVATMERKERMKKRTGKVVNFNLSRQL